MNDGEQVNRALRQSGGYTTDASQHVLRALPVRGVGAVGRVTEHLLSTLDRLIVFATGPGAFGGVVSRRQLQPRFVCTRNGAGFRRLISLL